MAQDWLPDLSDASPQDWQWLPIQWRDFGGANTFSGQIETVSCYRDNSMIRKCLEQDGKGKVLFIDGKGDLSRALLGDQLAEKAVKNGWHGIVVFGAVRDINALAKCQIGIKALGVCPVKTLKRGEGEINISLHIKGKEINPGDFLVADAHGILLTTMDKLKKVNPNLLRPDS